MGKHLLTADEVADLFGVSRATVRRRTTEGKIPSVDTAFGRRYRLSEIVSRDDESDINGKRDVLRNKILNARDALEAVLEVL